MKHLLGTLILFLCSTIIWAQEVTITGKVTSADDGTPIPGVSVLVEGTTNGTITSLDGDYSLKVNKGDVLMFSFIGMQTQKVTIESQLLVNIVLAAEISDLDEVVVVGYGTQKKKDLTGAVGIVGSKTIDEMKPITTEQALQGTVTGVNVTAQSGAPGSGVDIRIRGIGTNGDASPTVIIDGYQGDLSLLNPDDIETITVLKDAQAAIYGTIGANGVVLITTKKGRKNAAPKVTVNSSVGMQETSRKVPLLNATEYAVILNEALAANGEDLAYTDISGLGKGTNWQNEVFETAPVYNNSATVSGGSEKVIYSFSGSDLQQKGIVGKKKSQYKRNTGKLNLGIDLTDDLKFNSSLIYTYFTRKTLNENGLGSVLFNAINMDPTTSVYDEDGEYSLASSDLGDEIINPLAQIDNTYNDYDYNKLSGTFGFEYDVLPQLKVSARLGFNRATDNSRVFSMEIDYGGKVFDNTESSVYQSKSNYNNYTFDAFVTYDKTFAIDHHVTATLGNTVYRNWGDNLNATGYDVPYNSWEYADISLCTTVSESLSNGSWSYENRRLSYFGRLQYDYNSKYLLSAMLRRDASSRFGDGNKFAYFPSATAGWIISDENFMKGINNIDFIKIRASYGILGSDKIDDYEYTSSLDGEATYVFDDALVYGVATGGVVNEDIKWEESEQVDVGLDIKLFNNKVDFNMDYFVKTTKNLLLEDVSVSGILGASAPGASGPTKNAGTVENKGFEFALGYRGNINNEFTYKVNFNLTTLKNKVLQVNNSTGYEEGGSFGVGQDSPARMEVGMPIGYFYGYKTDGLFQTQTEVDAAPSQLDLGAEASPGDIKYVDTDGDGEITTSDKVNIGDPIPDMTLGLNLSMNYKGFDFLAYAYASIGNDMVRNYERDNDYVNKLSTVLNRWTGEGTSNFVPRVTTAATTNMVFSDYFVEDASFLRIQNVQLGYTLPKNLVNKVKIDKIRFYAAVSNLYTFTDYTGFDPTASTGDPIGGGIDYGFYPSARTYTFGLNLNF
jgi:TonB-linked SusC/RagA family outer membrane protein